MFRAISQIISNSYVRLAMYFAIGAAALPFACDCFWQPLIKDSTDKLATHLAQVYGSQVSTRSAAISCLSTYRLSWIYSTAHGKVLGKPVAPELAEFRDMSRDVHYDGKPYYEAVTPLPNNEFLHVGVSVSPITDGLFGNPLVSQGQLSLPLGYVLLVLAGLFLVTAILLNLAILSPLKRLRNYAAILLSSNDAELSEIEIGGAPEITKLGESIQQIRTAFNKISYERLTKEHRLRKEHRQLESEKQTIASEYEQHVAETQRSISELHTKEVEEEFLTSLARELDSMTSISSTCQRALERLNTKFPTTITAGAFFISGKQNQCKLESTVGLSTEAIDLIDQLDHQPMFSELFSKKTYITIERKNFSNYGLSALADAELHNAVYLPLTFQNRNIGVLAVFSAEPRQAMHERLRILRSVSELCSRVLRLLLYREELEAARTDALTGVYDKKFVCELFERAALNSTPHSTSIMMIDGDDFKSISDKHGHERADQVIKELARTVRKFTRMREYGMELGRPNDYVIRYGVDQLLVILEKTHSERAMHVAKRIRRAIENKTDWPGGISGVTASFGMSTFPSDANSIDELMLNAERALGHGKEQLGKNAVCHSSQLSKDAAGVKDQPGKNAVSVPVPDSSQLPSNSAATEEPLSDLTLRERQKNLLKSKILQAKEQRAKPIDARDEEQKQKERRKNER